MKKFVFILLCMLCRSFIFCTAQQLDMQHNMFRSGDVIKKMLCTLTEDSTDCKETKLWTIHGKDDDMSVLQKFYQSNDSLRNLATLTEYDALDRVVKERLAISAIDWSVADESDTYGKRGYIFSYDGMSRLTAAGYLENGKRNDHFSTSYKYDFMGNILSLRREGLLNSGNYGTIDDLTYSYKGNQVVKIDDAAEESPSYRGAMHFRDYADEETEYTYDANGNMLTDSNKGITCIDYNVLDLPQCICTKSRALFKENSNRTR